MVILGKPRNWAVGVLAVASLSLAACSGGGSSSSNSDDGDSSSAPPTSSEALSAEQQVVVPAWENTSLKPFSQPEMIGGVLVFITRARADQLDVVGLDPATGKVLWRHPYFPRGGLDAEAVVSLKSPTGDKVVFPEADKKLTRDSDEIVRAVVLDPTTGRVVGRGEKVNFNSSINPCLKHPADLCFEGIKVIDNVSHFNTYRISSDDFSVKVTAYEKLADIVEPLGDHLYSLPNLSAPDPITGAMSTASENIGREVKGKLTWNKPGRDIFGDGYETYRGSVIRFDESRDLYLAQAVRSVDDYATGKATKIPLDEYYKVVAVRARDGKVVWEQPGSDLFCFPDGVAPADSGAVCGVTGTFIAREGKPSKIPGLQATIYAVDPGTGNKMWEVEVAKPTSRTIALGSGLTKAGPTSVVADVAGQGKVALNLADGTTEPLDPAHQYVCRSQAQEFTYAVPYRGSPREVNGSSFVHPCTLKGKSITGDPTVQFLTEEGLDAGDGWRVLLSKDGVRGYEVP